MSSFDLVVSYPTLKAANAALERLGVTASKSAKVTTKAFRAMQTEFARNLREVNNQITTSQRLETQKRKEAQAAVAAATKAANATKAQARELERLAMKYKPLYAASKGYERALEEVEIAYQTGTISSRQYAASLEQVNQRFVRVQAGADTWSNQIVQGSRRAGRAMNSSGMAMQQLGYQVGDFAVQVQSGQSALVAFSQQGTQLVGILPMISSQLGISTRTALGLSVGLGIGIPVVTSLAGVLFGLGKEAKSTGSKIEETTAKLDEYISLVESQDGYGGEGFSALRAELENTSRAYDDLIGIAKLNAFKAITDSLDEITSAAANTNYILGEIGEGGNLLGIETQLQGNITSFKDNREQVRLFLGELENLDSAVTLDEQYKAALQLSSAFSKVVGDAEGMDEEQLTFHTNLLENIYRMELMGAAVSEVTSNQREANELLEAGRLAQIERNRVGMDTLRDLQDQISLQNTLNDSGEDSAEYVRARAEQEAIALNLNEKNTAEYIRLTLALRQAKEIAIDFSLIDIGASIRPAITSAAQLAKNLWSAATAMATAKQTQADSAGRGRGSSQGNTVGVPEDGYGFRTQLANLAFTPSNDNTGSSGVSSGGGGGGSSSRVDPQKTLLQLQAQAIAVAELAANLTIEGDILREIQSLEKDLGDTRDQYSDEAIRQSAEFIVAEEQKRDAIAATQKQQEDLAKSIANTMGNSLMSVVDGTKSVEEAFKEMAASIIKQLFEVLVVQRLVANLTATLGGGGGGTNLITGIVGAVTGSADGNVLGSGNVIPFATGGVVSSAIMFPMAGNKTGLMGEAGPEAIMPLSRGSDGKLGVKSSGSNDTGDVNIYQTFSFAANGDESVKKLISQAAPEIAKMTKASMINDRRRGGATKQAFG